jgi:hypothetical protein
MSVADFCDTEVPDCGQGYGCCRSQYQYILATTFQKEYPCPKEPEVYSCH